MLTMRVEMVNKAMFGGMWRAEVAAGIYRSMKVR